MNVDIMTISRNTDGEFKIISDVPGSALYHENELEFLKGALQYLEDIAAKMQREDDEFRSNSSNIFN